MNANARILPSSHRFTVEEYHRLGEAGIFSEDDRVELIEGEIIDMAPIGTKHAECVSRLTRLFVRGVEARVRVQDPILLGSGNEPQPDIAIVRNRSYATAHPGPEDVLLLIEVADTSLAYDRSTKIPLYARHGIPEVWLVDLAGRAVEVFRQPSAEGYLNMSRHGPGDQIRPALLEEIEIDPADALA